MFKSWLSPEPDISTAVKFREYVKQLHDQIISAGTNVEHVTSVEGQFNFETEKLLVKPSRYYGKPTNPLIYKFTGTSGNSVYIKLSFYYGGYHASSTTDTQQLTTRVGVWNTLDECINEFPISNYIMTHTTAYITSTIPTQVKSLQSIIHTTGDTLAIIASMGYEGLNSAQNFTHSPMFVIIKINSDGFTRLSNKYFPITDVFDTSSAVTIIGGSYYETYICNNNTLGQNIAYLAKQSNINTSIVDNITPLTYDHINGGLDVFEGMYLYNRNVITEFGPYEVSSKTLWLTSDSLRQYNWNNDNAALAFDMNHGVTVQ